MLSLLLAGAGVATLVSSRHPRVHLSAGARHGALGLAALLLVASAFDRAGSGTELLQFTILGLAAGSIYAIAAAGLVLTYTTTGVFNFAHGALGMISAFVYWQLRQEWDLPAALAAAVVLGVVGPAIGLVLELMFRRFRDADVGTSIVLTIAVTVLCIGLAQFLFDSTEAHNLPFVFGPRTVDIAGATITWDNVAQIVLAAAIAVALRVLLHRSRTGTAMRAVVDNPPLAALNGASPTTVARVSWVLGTELAIVAGILIGSGTNLEAITLTFFVVSAYGAAVFGRLRSLPLTFAGALVLGVVQSWGSAFWFPNTESDFALADAGLWRRIGVSLPGIFLFFALLALPEAKLTAGRIVGRARPPVPGLAGSLVRAVAFVGALVVLAPVIPTEHIPDATRGLIFGVIMLSLVLLTGFSGQVSLAQYVFVALGAWAMGSFFGGSSILGMLAAGLVAVPFGAVVALPTLRLQGLYLALVTFGVASISRDLIIQDPRFYGSGPVTVGRLELFGASFAGDRAFFVLCGIVFAAVAVGVLAIRRGPFGRRLAALRDSQAACATLGLDVRRTKLAVFCTSAFIAGLAGSLFGGLQVSVADIPFEPINNIVLLLFAVVGGITTVSGALIGGLLFALLPYVQSEEPALAGLVFAGVAVVAIGLGRQPNGLAGIVLSWVRPGRARRAVPARLPARAAGAVAATAVLLAAGGVGAEAAAAAPARGAGPLPQQELGGFDLAGRANGVQVTYNVENVFPLPPPLFQLSVPEALATTVSGPTSTALGSAAYPGNVLGNLPAIVEQASPGDGGSVPPYPLAARADHPAGPAEASQDIGTVSSHVRASEAGAEAVTTMVATSMPGVASIGAVTTSAGTSFEGEQVVSRSRAEAESIDLLFGLIHLEGVVTDLVATSDGTTAAADGATTIASITVLGMPATIGPEGIEVEEPQAPADPGPTAPVVTELIGPLGQVADGAGAVTTPLNAALQEVLAASGGSIEDALAQAGITLRLFQPVSTVDGAEASITANGLVLDLRYDGRGDNPLATLLAAIPSDQLPGEGIPGVPLNTSPQAMVNLMRETHVQGMALAYGTAGVVASPGFSFTMRPPIRGAGMAAGTGGGGAASRAGFTTPTPSLAGAGGSAGAGDGSTDDTLPIGLARGTAVGATAVLLALLSVPLWAVGSRRLAEGALGATGGGCPDGLDRPPERGAT